MDKYIQMIVLVDREILQELKMRALIEKRSMSAIVRELVSKYLGLSKEK